MRDMPLTPTEWPENEEHRRKLAEAINAVIVELRAIDARLTALENA